jgi:polar amino acid transport system permease protein
MQTLIEQWPRFFSGPNILFLATALAHTVLLSLASCCIGLVLGFLIASTRLTHSWALLPLRLLLIGITDALRRIPPLVVLFLVFFGFSLIQVDIEPFWIALIALTLIATAFIAEIVRSGFKSITREQWDAAAAMNFTLVQTLTHVVVPQAWKIIVPTVSLFFVLFIKDTSLASQIGVLELTFVGKTFIDRGFSPILSFGTVLILYFLLSFPLARAGQWLEARLAAT